MYKKIFFRQIFFKASILISTVLMGCTGLKYSSESLASQAGSQGVDQGNPIDENPPVEEKSASCQDYAAPEGLIENQRYFLFFQGSQESSSGAMLYCKVGESNSKPSCLGKKCTELGLVDIGASTSGTADVADSISDSDRCEVLKCANEFVYQSYSKVCPGRFPENGVEGEFYIATLSSNGTGVLQSGGPNSANLQGDNVYAPCRIINE
ncbi:MAG: hypothetical protein K1X29_07070 [Bdellovibrionales bacterium]|nr:hypothetical protein [Bdellovibrionales bacterium]